MTAGGFPAAGDASTFLEVGGLRLQLVDVPCMTASASPQPPAKAYVVVGTAEPARPAASAGLVDAAGLATYLGVSREWVYDHAEQLGARKLGDGPRPRLRFDIADAVRRLPRAEKKTDPINDGQRKALNAKAAHLSRLRNSSKAAMKAEAYTAASLHFDRAITSSTQLSWAEADWTIDWLAEEIRAWASGASAAPAAP